MSDQYAVFIDAGSSGSRVYVYAWPEHGAADKGKFPSIKVDKAWSKKIKPGLSSYSSTGRGIDKLWKDHLSQLVSHAEAIVPKHQQPRTPVFVLATAGMRLLPEDDQTAILSQTCRLLKTKSPFFVPDGGDDACSSHVAVIDGETEGLYGWLALNYLIKGDDAFNEPEAQSYGFMDMGGASSQIAFSPNITEAKRHWDDLFRVNLRTIDGHDHRWDVFVSTWLGFGANEARKRFLDHLIDLRAGPGPINDPCLPIGSKQTYVSQSHNDTFAFQGVGEFGSCLSAMYPLLHTDVPCDDEPCLFNGVHAPAIDFDTNRFVGVSEYWYTANDVLKLGGKYDFVKFSARAKEYCGRKWDGILREAKVGAFKGIPIEILESACFKATWVTNILHNGFGVPITALKEGRRALDERDSLITELEGHDGEESSGGEEDKSDGENDGSLSEFVSQSDALFGSIQNITFSHNIRVSDMSQLVAKGHLDPSLAARGLVDSSLVARDQFDDPFQTAVDINGKELSWTLGRAVLYASSQIPAANSDQHPVGHVRARQDDNEHFVSGGEVGLLPAKMPESHHPITLFIFVAVVLLAVVSIYKKWGRHQLSHHPLLLKARRSLLRLMRLPFSKGAVGSSDEDLEERLLEEGGPEVARHPFKDAIPMDHYQPSYHGSPVIGSPVLHQGFGSSSSLLDLKGQAPPSRVNSRLSMRMDQRAERGGALFGIGDEEPRRQFGIKHSKSHSSLPNK